MNKFRLKLVLLSSTLVGSGMGFGSEIDTDVVFDNLGLPYIPAKRIKGCLRDAVIEAQEMFEIADITQDIFQVKDTFGEKGKEGAPVYFSNFYIEEYKTTRKWLNYFLKHERHNGIITPDRVLDTFTEIRQQTKINKEGVALKHSLRTSRALRTGLVFYGNVLIETDSKCALDTLLLACLNFRRFGTKRNRGFGEVCCTLLNEKNQELSINKVLEGLLCTK